MAPVSFYGKAAYSGERGRGRGSAGLTSPLLYAIIVANTCNYILLQQNESADAK
jgi:hypothetical protein